MTEIDEMKLNIKVLVETNVILLNEMELLTSLIKEIEMSIKGVKSRLESLEILHNIKK